MTAIEELVAAVNTKFNDPDIPADVALRWFAGWRETLPVPVRVHLDRGLAAGSVTGWRAHPAALMYHLTGDAWWLRPHVVFLSLKFRDAVTGVSPRQIWNLPPRLGKTRVLDAGEIWNIDRTAGQSMSIRVTHAITLAARSSLIVRNMIAHPDVNATVGTPPAGTAAVDKATQTEWYTSAGGGMLATSMSAQVLGFGVGRGGVLSIDDPMKDWQEAHSKTQRDRAHNQYRGTFRHRLDDETSAILLVMQRLHRDDLSGRLLEDMATGNGDDFELVAIPHIAEENDPLGREPGEPIDPLAFTAGQARSRAIALGSHVAAAVEQQHPAEEEGNELLRDWFRIEDQMPTKYDQLLTSWDLKLKNNESGDFVVGQAWGRTGSDLWMIDQVRGRFDHATTANAIALLQVRNPTVRQHVVEAAGSASDVLPTLTKAQPEYEISEQMAGRLAMTVDEREAVQTLRRRGMTGIVTHPPKGDKVTRARTWIAPLAEAGNIHLDARGPWLPAYLDELAGFPADPDDQVDATSQACQRLQTSRGGISKVGSKRKIPRQVRPATGRPGSGASRTR